MEVLLQCLSLHKCFHKDCDEIVTIVEEQAVTEQPIRDNVNRFDQISNVVEPTSRKK
jgi:hypothetical protein